MDEELHLSREIVMDHIVEKWDVEASSCQVCHDEYAIPPFTELVKLVLTGTLVH